MENMLRSFDNTIEDSERELEYEFHESTKGELEDDEPPVTRTEGVNPMWFIPDRYYVFIEKLYILMVESLKHNFTPTVDMIIDADPIFQDGKDPYLVNHQVILRKWKKLAEQFQFLGEFRLCNKKSPTLRLPWFEEWGHIVRSVHEEGHRRNHVTAAQIKEKGWVFGQQSHGIPWEYIKDYIRLCPHCVSKKLKEKLPTNLSSQARARRLYSLQFEVPIQELDSAIQKIILDYKVNLVKFKTWKVNAISFKAIVTLYRCHRGAVYRRGQRKSNLQRVTIREQFVSKHCGCEFVLKVVEPYAEEKDARLSLDVEEIKGPQAKLYLRNHTAHEPGSDADYFFLPIHTQAIYYCEENLTTFKDVHAALLASRRRARFLREVALSHEQVFFRF